MIADTLIKWHQNHGRHDLPWQNTKDAYRIWISEIMLQQTQVATVIPYYERFMHSFPNAIALANAKLDDVLHHWTGLGYYARARNLHKAAIAIRDEHAGLFPSNFDEVVALPGIGRSTAGAILAFSQNQRHAILDGNVKRVLARYYEIEGWYGKKEVEDRLWEYAEKNTPQEGVAIYTQAIMDFGATLCTRSKPQCGTCPLSSDCKAFKHDRQGELPHGKPKKAKPIKHCYMLIIKNDDGAVLLEQNPPSGIWGGLWCPPQVVELKEVDPKQYKMTQEYEPFRHTFSHYHLDITPVELKPIESSNTVAEDNAVWYKSNSEQALGLAAPVKKLLQQFA